MNPHTQRSNVRQTDRQTDRKHDACDDSVVDFSLAVSKLLQILLLLSFLTFSLLFRTLDPSGRTGTGKASGSPCWSSWWCSPSSVCLLCCCQKASAAPNLVWKRRSVLPLCISLSVFNLSCYLVQLLLLIRCSGGQRKDAHAPQLPDSGPITDFYAFPVCLNLVSDCRDTVQATKSETPALFRNENKSERMMWTSFVFFLLLPVDDGGKRSGSPLTLDDLFNRNFQVHDPGAKWINGIHTHTKKQIS